ncbi:hypothetical protein C8R45DRAFT_1074450 [Mycena sanguinolenta]|nr:hypothetical protein C8R45DRAFT_1074450 [Mycena sanguinolenta]
MAQSIIQLQIACYEPTKTRQEPTPNGSARALICKDCQTVKPGTKRFGSEFQTPLGDHSVDGWQRMAPLHMTRINGWLLDALFALSLIVLALSAVDASSVPRFQVFKYAPPPSLQVEAFGLFKPCFCEPSRLFLILQPTLLQVYKSQDHPRQDTGLTIIFVVKTILLASYTRESMEPRDHLSLLALFFCPVHSFPQHRKTSSRLLQTVKSVANGIKISLGLQIHPKISWSPSLGLPILHDPIPFAWLHWTTGVKPFVPDGPYKPLHRLTYAVQIHTEQYLKLCNPPEVTAGHKGRIWQELQQGISQVVDKGVLFGAVDKIVCRWADGQGRDDAIEWEVSSPLTGNMAKWNASNFHWGVPGSSSLASQAIQ